MVTAMKTTGRSIEVASSKLVIIDKSNIELLTSEKQRELMAVYYESYKSSIWTTSPDRDPEVAAQWQKWYGSDDGKAWFRDALKFYVERTREGKGELILAEEKKNGRIIGGAFMLNGQAFIDNIDRDAHEVKGYIERMFSELNADPKRTVYFAEMFIVPEYRGWRGGAVTSALFNNYIEYATAEGYKHMIAWTLDRADNSVLKMLEKLGFSEIPGGRGKKGTEMFSGRFTESTRRDAVYFYKKIGNATEPLVDAIRSE